MKHRITTLLLAFFVTTLFLNGCGIKPRQVDPPQGKENDHFPHTYPDISTDPRP